MRSRTDAGGGGPTDPHGGDLAKRKLVPALYNVAVEGGLPETFALVGFSRSAGSDEELRVTYAGDGIVIESTEDGRATTSVVQPEVHHSGQKLVELGRQQRLAAGDAKLLDATGVDQIVLDPR